MEEKSWDEIDDDEWNRKVLTKAEPIEIVNETSEQVAQQVPSDRSTDSQFYSHKALLRIKGHIKSSALFHETFGQFKKFIATHQADQLDAETLVELINLDIMLMEIPFYEHNKMLLEELSKIQSFWTQIIHFLNDFFETKHSNKKFLSSVNMTNFFENIESIMFHMMASDLFDSYMESVFAEILDICEINVENEWSHVKELKDLKKYFDLNKYSHQTYDIYPTLDDLKLQNKKVDKYDNENEYDNVAHYLKVQLSILKENFFSHLRVGINQLQKISISKKPITKLSTANFYPNVKIEEINKVMMKINCGVTVARLTAEQSKLIDWSQQFFNGYLLFFTSSIELNDLVTAIVINSNTRDQDQRTICLKIINKENIEIIRDKKFIMFDSSKDCFEPYRRVFNLMKNLNEHNFPMKDQIVHLKEPNTIERSKPFMYKNFKFKINELINWPSWDDLKLDQLQLTAMHRALNNAMTIIEGPPGNGKTYVGLEILKIILQNTDDTVLVLTQTNSSLDRFLIGASKLTKSIVRFGGRCKSPELQTHVFKPSTHHESKMYLEKLKNDFFDEISILSKMRGNSEEIRQKFERYHRMYEEVNHLNSFCTVRSKRVIGMTTTYAAIAGSVLKMLKPEIVIIDEASCAHECYVIASLTKNTKQLIMLGDELQPQQLEQSVLSLFERLIVGGINYSKLETQMRMRPIISDLVKQTIYQEIKDSDNDESYPAVIGMETNLFCLNHKNPEKTDHDKTSKINEFEAELVVKLSNFLVKSGNKDITILTPYVAQAELIKSGLKSPFVKVAVLDAYQGQESNIVLISLVRSNSQNDIGFLRNESRIADLLTRGRIGMYIIGNMTLFSKTCTLWKQIFKYLTEKQSIGSKFPGISI